jgi:hypothetical protein
VVWDLLVKESIAPADLKNKNPAESKSTVRMATATISSTSENAPCALQLDSRSCDAPGYIISLNLFSTAGDEVRLHPAAARA